MFFSSWYIGCVDIYNIWWIRHVKFSGWSVCIKIQGFKYYNILGKLINWQSLERKRIDHVKCSYLVFKYVNMVVGWRSVTFKEKYGIGNKSICWWQKSVGKKTSLWKDFEVKTPPYNLDFRDMKSHLSLYTHHIVWFIIKSSHRKTC